VLTWTEKKWSEAQEALIGVLFVVTACVELLILANNPHGGEHLKDLLVGQISVGVCSEPDPDRNSVRRCSPCMVRLARALGQAGFYVLLRWW